MKKDTNIYYIRYDQGRQSVVFTGTFQYLKFDGVEIADLFKDKDGNKVRYPEDTQKYLGEIIGVMDNDDKDYLDRATETLFELAPDMPNVIKTAFGIAGHSNSDFFYAIFNKMQNRTISQNMPVLFALYNYPFLRTGKVEGEPSKRDIEYFEKLYAINSYAAKKVVRGLASTGYFANAKLSPELRKEQNIIYFGQIPLENLKERALRMKTEFFDMYTVGRFVFGKNLCYDHSYGKTDEHGRISDFDKKVQEILLNFTHKVEPHDKENGGKEKTLNRRFQEMMVMMYNGYYNEKVNDFSAIPYDMRNGIIKDMYVKTAKYDIKNGRAEDLDKQTLQAVLNNDARGYYLSMLPEGLTAKMKLSLTPIQQEMVFATKDNWEKYHIIGMPDSMPHLSLKQKEEILQRIDKKQQEKSGLKANYEQKIGKAAEEKDVVERLRKDLSDKRTSLFVIERLQKGYARIKNNVRGDAFSKEEQKISIDAANKCLEKAVLGEYEELKMPEYGHLPLFHRAGEIERRNRMAEAIAVFNESVKAIIAQRAEKTEEIDTYDSLRRYAKSGLLSARTMEIAENDIKLAHIAIDGAERSYKQKYGVNTSELLPEENYLKNILEQEAAFKQAQNRISQKKHNMQEKARSNVLPPEMSNLKADEGKTDDEKRDIRAQNKKVIDPLQAKMEKSQRK